MSDPELDTGYFELPATNGLATDRAKSRVAVIIPTKDRPEFLDEAISSALKQTHTPCEIVVVDDGSAVAVNESKMKSRHGPKVRVIRNDPSRGLAFSRNRGVEETNAEYVIHLDDDDLLSHDAIDQCLSVLQDFPEVEWIMFAAKGFGPKAEYFNRNQPPLVMRVIEQAHGMEANPNTVIFGRRLFPVLLQTVPIAFQRVMISKTKWTMVSQLRWQVYSLDPTVNSNEAAKVRIAGFLRDSEWARYAALMCDKVALITKPLYLVRCSGQGYSSQSSNRQIHANQTLEIMEHLERGARKIPAMAKWKPQIRRALAQTYFDYAYTSSESGNQREAWYFLKRSLSTRTIFKQFRLAARIGLRVIRSATSNH